MESHHHTYPDYGYAFGVSYWLGNTAASPEEADRACLYIGPPGYAYPKIEYRLPAQKHEMESLIRGMMQVFKAGNKSARKELQSWLEAK